MLVAAFACLASSSALGQGLSKLAPGQKNSASAPLITPDANVVAHVWFPKTALVDTKSNAFTMQGTVPITASALFKAPRSGAGAFSTSNYFNLASTNALQFTSGDFTVCVVARPNSLTATGQLVANTGTNIGWDMSIATTGRLSASAGTGTGFTYATANSNNFTAGGLGIGCVGRSGTTLYSKSNGGTTATGTGAWSPASAAAARIGRAVVGSATFDGTIYEVYATTSAWDETAVSALQAAVMAKFK